MLARRFIVVCMLLTLFGMWLSALVAGADGATRPEAQVDTPASETAATRRAAPRSRSLP